LFLNGVQTTLHVGRIPKLDEFKKENSGPLAYLLEKYRAWKELKEKGGKEGGVVGCALPKLAAL
jgi:hypothetical protein